MEEAGEHRGGAVDGLLHAAVAPRAPGDPALGPLLGGEGIPVDDGPEGPRGAAGHRLAVEAHALLHQLAGQGGEELDGVAVDVDHRVVQPLTDLRGAETAPCNSPSGACGSPHRVMRARSILGNTRGMAFDVVIRNGTVVDGSGFGGYRADVGIAGGVITRVGRIRERGAEEVDAEGHVVTPGFVDGHTHMDAQVFWDPQGANSCWHGVTTAVMGNCGFTLAPVRDDARALVVRNLERAEDIDPVALRLAGVGLADVPRIPRRGRRACRRRSTTPRTSGTRRCAPGRWGSGRSRRRRTPTTSR